MKYLLSLAEEKNNTHLRNVAPFIPDIDDGFWDWTPDWKAYIYCTQVLNQRFGEEGLPYGQKLSLGWVIIRDVFWGKNASTWRNKNQQDFNSYE